MGSISGSLIAASILVGLVAVPAASQDLASSQEFSTVENVPENAATEIRTFEDSDSFVRSVSTAFDEFIVNISSDEQETTLETSEGRLETYQSPEKREQSLLTPEGEISRTLSAEKEVLEVKVPEGRLVEKKVDGGIETVFDGTDEAAALNAKQELEERLEDTVEDLDTRRQELREEASPDIEIYIQPDAGIGDGEYIELRSLESEEIDLEDWSIRDETGREYVFDEGSLPAGDSIRVYSDNSDADYNWDTSYVWNMNGDTAYLHDSEGELVKEHNY